jgi:undecaprenyl-diphosphatase
MKRARRHLLAKRYRRFLPWVLLVLGTIVISVFAHLYDRFPGDSEILKWLQGIDLPLFQSSMKAIDAIAFRLVAPVAVGLCALFLWLIHRRPEAFFIAVGLFPYGAGALIKGAVDRPRPWELDQGVTPWFLVKGSAFPSGHIMHFVLFYGFLLYLTPTLVKNRRARTVLQVLLVLLLLTAAPAVVTGARHWPSDVIGGYMVGGLFLAALIWGYEHSKGDRFDRWYEALRGSRWWPQTERLTGRWPMRREKGPLS